MRMTRKRTRRLRRKKEFGSQILRRSAGLLLGAGLLFGSSTQTLAMPQGGQVAAGAADIARNGAEMAIRQMTQNAVINWQSFGIAAGERVNILQPNAQAALLNHVVGNDPSAIFGALAANGRVFVVNPAGVLFAPDSQVNVGSLVASTLKISDADFMAGRYAFVGNAHSGKVLNQGKLIAEHAGAVALLAPQVENDGVIVAKKGKVELTAGTKVALDFTGDGTVSVLPSQEAIDAAVMNKGLVEADGGLVFLTAQTGEDLIGSAVNQDGIVRARSLDGKTGTVRMTANDVRLGSGSATDVTGAQGGTVEAGGGWQGAGSLSHAKNVTMEQGAKIDASAKQDGGAGGVVALWSDGETKFAGEIVARGKGAGAGGSIETSGHRLTVEGLASAASDSGRAGKWLLDPANVFIEADSVTPAQAVSGGTNTYTADDTKIHASQIESVLNTGTDVEIVTGSPTSGPEGNIMVNAPIHKTAGSDVKLTLKAWHNIVVNRDIASTSGKLGFDFLSASDDKNGGGYIRVNAVHLNTNGGNLLLHGGTNRDGVDYASSSWDAAGILLNGTTIDTSGGSVILKGVTNHAGHGGVQLDGATITAGNTGTIQLVSRNDGGGDDLSVDSASHLQAGRIVLAADKAKLEGAFQGIDSSLTPAPAAGATAEITVAPRTASRNVSIGGTGTNALNLPASFLDGTKVTGFDATAIGADDGTGTVSIDAEVHAAGNLKLRSPHGKVAVNQAVTVDPGHALTVAAGTEVKAPGKITADEVNLETDDAKVELTAANEIQTVTGKAGSLALKNAVDIALGKAGTPSEGLTLKSGASEVESAGDITVAGDGVASTGTGSLSLTTSTAKHIRLEQNTKIKGTGTNQFDLKVRTGTLDLASGVKINATGGKADFAINKINLPGTETDLIQSTDGEVKIDTAAAGGVISIGTATPSGLALARLDFIAAGAKNVGIGSKDTGTVTIGTASASSPLAVESGTGIALEGGTAGSTNKDFSLRAPSIAFTGAQSLSAGSGSLTLEADTITNWANAMPSGTGTITVKRKTKGSDYTIGGTGTYLDNTALAKLKAGGFHNVVIGDKTDAGKLTISSITDLPIYTSLLSKGGIHFDGPITSGEGAGKTLVAYSENGMTEGAGSSLAVDDVLLWGKGDFVLDTVQNKIRHLATDLSDGKLALSNLGSLQTASVQNRNTNTAVAGVEAKNVKLDVNSGTLDIAEKLKATEKADLKSDSMTFAPGKLETKKLRLNKQTNTADIQIGGTASGAWNLNGSKFDDLKVGGEDYHGNVNVADTTFAGNADIETHDTAVPSGKGNVTMTGNNLVGTTAEPKNMTITAEGAKLPGAGDKLEVNKLTLNLKGGLDLGNGKVKGHGELKLGGVGATQNIFVSDTYNRVTDPNPGGYKVSYGTVNNVLAGFDAINLEGHRDVFFDAGALKASINVKAARDIVVRDDVNVNGAASTVTFEAGRDFKLEDNKKIDVAGAKKETVFNVTANQDITFGQNAKVELKTPTGIVKPSVTANLKTENGKVTFGQNASFQIHTNEAGRLDVQAKETKVESGTEIDTGGAGTFALSTDKLTDGTAGTSPSIKGKGTLAIQPLTSGHAMHIGDGATASAGELVVTSDQLNGHLFGQDFVKMFLGSHTDAPGKAGVVTVDGLNLQKASGKKAVDVSLAAGNEVKIGASGMTLGDGARLNVRTDKLSNRSVGTAARGKISVGNMSSLHVYVNNIDDLQASAGAPAVVGSGGILGLRTLDAGRTLALGDGVTGDMKITNSFMKNVVGNGFSEYDFGQGGADGGTTQETIHVGDFDPGADRSKHTYLTANHIEIKGKFVQHGTDSVILRSRGDVKEDAAASLEAKNLRLEFKGTYTLDSKNNKIGIIAANHVGDVSITSDKLTVGTVTQPEKIDSTTVTIHQAPLYGLKSTGNIKLTTDSLTLDKEIQSTVSGASAGTKTLTIEQKTPSRALYLGAENAAGLSIKADALSGANKKIAGGFKEVELGRADGTGKAYVSGEVHLDNPTTINGLGGVEFTGGKIVGNNKDVGIRGKRFKMDAASELTAGSGNLMIAADTLDIAGAPNGSARVYGSGRLNVKTLDTARDLYLQKGAKTTDPDALGGLNLFSEYFEDDDPAHDVTDTRVFRDGFSLITIGDENATGNLVQSGTVGFTDPVNIVQALHSAAGGVTVSGSIDTHGNDYSIKSRKVTFSKVHIINYKGDPGTGPSVGPYTYITTDEFVVDDDSHITSDGVVKFSTYTPEKKIDVDTPAASAGTNDPLKLDPKIFSETGLLRTGTVNGHPVRFQNIIIGDAGAGDINPSGLRVGKGLTDAVTLKSGGKVSGTGAVTGIDKLNIEANEVSLTNENNRIGSIGKVKSAGKFELTTKGGVKLDGSVEAGAGKVKITNKDSGNVILGEHATIATTNNTPVYITAENGHFINNSTSSNPISGGRFAISTKDSVGDKEGTLNLYLNFHRYGTAYGTESIAGYTTGNGFFYYDRPTVRIYSERPYGDANTAFFTNAKYRFETQRVGNESAADKAARDAHDATALHALETRIKANGYGTTGWAHLDGSTHANANIDGTLRAGMGEFGSEVAAGGKNQVVTFNSNATSNPLNYKVELEYRVTPRELTLTAKSRTKTYDGVSYTNGEGYTVFGLTNGNTEAGVITIHRLKYGTLAVPKNTDGTMKKNAEGAFHAGTYGIGIAGSDVTLKNPDYRIQFVDGTLTVNKKAITVKPDNVTHVYGDLPDSLPGGLAAGSMLAAGDTLQGLRVRNTGSTDVGNYSNVLTATGAHIRNAAGVDVSNDYAVTSGTANLSITPRTVYIDAGEKERTYGEANSAAAYPHGQYSVRKADATTGLVYGDTIASVTEGISPSLTNTSDAGMYVGAVTASGASLLDPSKNGNYNFIYTPGEFIIKKKMVTVKANDATASYNGTAYTGNNGATYTGFLFGQAENTAAGMAGALSYAAKGADGSAAVHAGSYDLGVTGNLSATNYDFQYETGKLTITPLALTVKASDKMRLYGQDNGMFVGAVVAGMLAAGDTLGHLNVTTPATHASDAGSYAIALNPAGVTFGAGSHAKAGDYTITTQSGTLTVIPRPLTLYAGRKTRAYGAANSTAQYAAGSSKFRADGLVNGDTIRDVQEYIDANATLTADAGTPNLAVSLLDAGGNAHLVFGKGKVSNYAISYVDGKFSILPRLVYIGAKDASRKYGEPNPAATAYVQAPTEDTGLVFGAQIIGLSASYDASMGARTSAGKHVGVIHPSTDWTLTGGNMANYRFQYKPGALTIQAAGFPPNTPEGRATQGAMSAMSTVNHAVSGGSSVSGGSFLHGVPIGSISSGGGNVRWNPSGIPRMGASGTASPDSVANSLIPTTPGNVAIQIGDHAMQHHVAIGTDGSIRVQLGRIGRGAGGIGGSASGTSGSTGPMGSTSSSTRGSSDASNGTLSKSMRSSMSSTGDNAGYDTPDMGGAEEVHGKKKNVIPVLFTDGDSKRLDGMYQVEYSSQELSIIPSTEKAPIPSPDELVNGVENAFRLAYQQQGGEYEILFGNGIVAIVPKNKMAYDLIHSDDRAAERALLATGVMTAIEEMGVMPEQIRAVYIYTEYKDLGNA